MAQLDSGTNSLGIPAAIPRPEGHQVSRNFSDKVLGTPRTGIEQCDPLEGLDDGTIRTIDFLNSLPETHPLRPGLMNSLPDNIKSIVEQGIRPEAQVNTSSSNPVASASRPVSQLDRSDGSNTLTNSTSNRFQQSHHQNDLVASKYHELSLYPEGHPRRPDSLIDLAQALFSQFKETGNRLDLDTSVTYGREALDLCPIGHPSRLICANSLSGAIMIRFQESNLLRDLDEIIDLIP